MMNFLKNLMNLKIKRQHLSLCNLGDADQNWHEAKEYRNGRFGVFLVFYFEALFPVNQRPKRLG